MLPTHEELRQAVLPLPDHGEPGEVEEDDENRGNQEGLLSTVPNGTLSRRCRGKGQSS